MPPDVKEDWVQVFAAIHLDDIAVMFRGRPATDWWAIGGGLSLLTGARASHTSFSISGMAGC